MNNINQSFLATRFVLTKRASIKVDPVLELSSAIEHDRRLGTLSCKISIQHSIYVLPLGIHYTILPLTIILSRANTIYIKNQDFIRKKEPRENEKKLKKYKKASVLCTSIKHASRPIRSDS